MFPLENTSLQYAMLGLEQRYQVQNPAQTILFSMHLIDSVFFFLWLLEYRLFIASKLVSSQRTIFYPWNTHQLPLPTKRKPMLNFSTIKDQLHQPQDKCRIIHLSGVLLHSQFQACITPVICQVVCSHSGHLT